MNIKSRAYLSAFFASAALASIMLWLALTHNPQGAFYGSELGTDWAGIVFLWTAWFAICLVPLAAAIWLAFRLRRAPGK